MFLSFKNIIYLKIKKYKIVESIKNIVSNEQEIEIEMLK